MSARKSCLLRVGFAAVLVRLLGLVVFLTSTSSVKVVDYEQFVAVSGRQTKSLVLEEINSNATRRLAPFDGQWYIDIARNGYRRMERWPGGNYAFFPFYPMIIRAVDRTIGKAEIVTSIAGIVFSGLSAVCLWVLAERLGVPPWMPVAMMLAWPGGAFHVLVYSESLFLLLSAALAVSASTGGGGIGMGLALLGGLTRPQGVLLGTLFVPSSLQQSRSHRVARDRLKRFLCVLAPIASLGGYLLFLQVKVGSALAFFEIQENWGRSVDASGVAEAVTDGLHFNALPADAAAALMGVAGLPILFWYLPIPLALFGSLSVLMPLMTGTPLSMCRFLSVNFPLFLAVSAWLQRRPGAVMGFVLAGAMFQVWFLRRLAAWQFAG